MEKTLEKNLKILEEKNSLLAFQLRLIELTSGKERQSSSFAPQNDTEIVYCYGLQCDFKQIKPWLRKKSAHRLVLLEDDLSAFGDFLSQVEAERMLLDPQVKVITVEALQEVIEAHLFQAHELFILPGKNEAFRKIFADLQMQAEMTMCLYRDFGVPQTQNILQNLSFSGEILLGDALKGKFQGVPAILCGAGPSLSQQIETLQTLGEHALIFGGGSALGPLSEKGVPIHFGASLDPHPPTERFARQTYFELPFFYQNQVASELFQHLQGPRICFGESGGFPLERWILEQLGLYLPSFDAGTHVGTFLTHIAAHLGCSPIIFVGMDGCRMEGKTYSEGVERPEERGGRTDPLVVKDRFGNLAETRTDFLLGRSWIESFARLHPEIEFLNATEGGLSMEGVKDIPLKEVTLAPLFDTYAHVHHILESTPKISLPSEKVAETLQMVSQSVERCAALCREFLAGMGQLAVQEVKLHEEIFFQLVLLPQWEVWRPFLQKEEVIRAMQAPEIEKKIQQTLFFLDVCERYQRIFQ